MSSLPYEAKVLDQFHVSPPPNSVPQTILPLTFFDTLWLFIPAATQRAFFYEFPVSVSDFTLNVLPDLKRSLSLALQYFFPLAGNLVSPSQPSATTKPYILYKLGDSVTLTVVEANGDFNEVQADSGKDVRVLHRLVPDFPQPKVESDDVKCYPLLALQVTIFPNSGICIGISTRHVAADGKSSTYFLKSWASIFKSNGDVSCLQSSPPLHERDSIKDEIGVEGKFLDNYRNRKAYLKWDDPDPPADDIFDGMVKVTFVVKRCLADKLKKCILEQCKNNNEPEPQHPSTFVVTCAFIWICFVKSRREIRGKSISLDEEVEFCTFGFLADCRSRYGSGIPERYFGNCLASCLTHCKLKDVIGENGLRNVAKSIAFGIKKVEINGCPESLASVLVDVDAFRNPYFLSLAGSPKLKVYDLDFGWGKPKKCEVVHIDSSRAISLAEYRDEEGGIEIGVALHRNEMAAFTSFFEKGCKDLL